MTERERELLEQVRTRLGHTLQCWSRQIDFGDVCSCGRYALQVRIMEVLDDVH